MKNIHRINLQRFKCYAALLPLALLTACATQVPPTLSTTGTPTLKPTIVATTAEQIALRTLVAQQDRLYKVAAPLLTNNAALCKGNARNLLGFTAKNKYSYASEFTAAAQSLGFNERLQVSDILPGSGAARSGIQSGDILLSANDKAIPQGEDAERQTAAVLAPLVSGRTPIKLGLLRDGKPLSMDVPLTLACSFSIALGNADLVNAYADGRRVLVTRGMLSFVRSDEELAYLIAKELAHNSLSHPGRQKMVATLGGVIDNLLRTQPDMSSMAGSSGILPYNQDMDAAADTLALYMLARAGYNIDNVARFWQRLATQYPVSVPNSYTAMHPSTTYRLAMIGKVTQIIKAKQAADKPLTP